MRTFRDCKDRDWTIAVNVASVKRVRDLAKIDLLDLQDGATIQRLATDAVLLCDVLYAICRPEAIEKGVTDEDFGAAMAGDAIQDATARFLEDLVDFFPSQKRERLRRALDKFAALRKRVEEAAGEMLDSPALDDRLEQEVRDLTRRLLSDLTRGDSSTPSPVESASTPTPEP